MVFPAGAFHPVCTTNHLTLKTDIMKKTLFRHTLAFLLSVLLAVGFLILGAYIPQDPIDENIRQSADGMILEGAYPTMADHAFASILDYETDALILAESKAMSASQFNSILTNPQYMYQTANAVEDLHVYAADQNPEPSRFYVHYWMGFRPVMRLLLSFFDYYQILRYTAVVFFLLLAAVVCSIANRAGTKAAFAFMVSIILVRPHVIAVSLQFSCCFLLSFLAMLAVPCIQKKTAWISLFFLELGIITQYFDFYTTPILTFALPLIYLYILRQQDHSTMKLRDICVNAVSWATGYGLMWLAKLVLTSLLTPVDALGQGFDAFAGRVGIEIVSGMEDYYSPVAALRTVAASLYSDREGKLVMLILAAIFCICVLLIAVQRKITVKSILAHRCLLVTAALPLVWFMAAAQPTANHHWFQYRGIAATFWAGLVYLQLTLQKAPDAPAPKQ